MALVAGAGMGLQAQGLVLPGSDAVTIGRSGVGVAYGRSLEAAGLNPALLVTVQDPLSIYLGMGMEHASQQVTQQANSIVKFSSDRNRLLPSLGLAWKPSEQFSLGFRTGTQFLRHGAMPSNASVRFNGTSQDLKGNFAELAFGYAVTPAFSVGATVTALQVDQTQETVARVNVLSDGTQGPVTTLGLAEVGLRQTGKKTLSSATVGARYALGSRFTIGLTYKTGAKGDMPQDATVIPGVRGVYGSDGTSISYTGIDKEIQAALGRAQAIPGSAQFQLPSVLTAGFRHRVNQIFTWEVDAKLLRTSQMQLPGLPRLAGATGVGLPGTEPVVYRDSTSVSGMGEIALGKRWTTRFGFSVESPVVSDRDVNYMYGLGRQASFSAGATWKGLGGEVSLGYQYRQAQDAETVNLDGKWESTGYRRTGTLVRVEGQGHLWSLGYKVAF